MHFLPDLIYFIETYYLYFSSKNRNVKEKKNVRDNNMFTSFFSTNVIIENFKFF